MRRLIVLAVVCSACGGSPTTPAPSTVTLSGTVTATNGGQPLAGLTVDVAGLQTVTNGQGQFALETPTGRHQVMLSGAAIVPRVQSVNAGPVTLDAITYAGGFDLAFYRQLVRNGFQTPTGLEPVRRFTQHPVFDVQTDDLFIKTTVQAAIAATVPLLTGGQFSASFGPGIPVRFVSTLAGCGEAPVGPVGAYITIKLSCASDPRVAAHETGHVLGFWHTNTVTDLMFVAGLPFASPSPSAREQYHAAIAYRRPAGNLDMDTDP